jgi:hypothetical protein
MYKNTNKIEGEEDVNSTKNTETVKKEMVWE